LTQGRAFQGYWWWQVSFKDQKLENPPSRKRNFNDFWTIEGSRTDYKLVKSQVIEIEEPIMTSFLSAAPLRVEIENNQKQVNSNEMVLTGEVNFSLWRRLMA
jgi:hypothetical protein